ncbi:hypothetical protein OTU49_004355 [Cherax quadricarinatus]|uniref:Glycosyltransferase family 92 protein n=1 Tax=Cherax quadricarinatus TaxID=27406 RepID=A0AAW0X2A3_CHEQU
MNFCLKMIFLKNIRSQLVVLIIIAIFIWCYKFDNIVPLATKQVWLAYSDSHSHFSNILPSSPEEPSSVTMNGSTGFAAEEAETIDLTKMTQLPQKCDCKMKMRRSHSHTVQQLDLALPLFNLSTKEYLIKRHPNLPVDFLHKVNKEGSCSLLPSLFSIQWVNIHWQEVRVNTSTMLLYSAFYDPNPGGKPCVRLLGVTRSTKPPAGWCHLWFNTQQPPVVTRITNTDYLDYQTRNSDRQMPFLFTCPLPPKVAHLQPAAVSLVHQPCQPATTLLQVVGAKERETSAFLNGQKPFDPVRAVKGWVPAVCGPALYYYHEDFSKRMVEWLEILRAEGIGKVFLYVTDVHPNLEKVLKYYEDDGFLHLTGYSYPPPYINEPSLRRTPKKKGKPIGYRLKWKFFSNDLVSKAEEAQKLPGYLWALRHTILSADTLRDFPGRFKSLYDMDTVRGVFSHSAILCTTGKCSLQETHKVSPTVAYLGHFSGTCGHKCDLVNSTKEELFLLKYKTPVTKAVTNVLTKLKLI